MRALVTGGSGEIGAAICRKLAQNGYFVYIHCHRGQQRAQQLQQELAQQGHGAEVVCFDLAQAEQVSECLQQLLEQGPIQALIHNAGIYDDVPMVGMTAEQWHKVIDISLNGFYHLSHSLLMPMMRTRRGRIIAMSSVAASMGNRGQCNYAAAKAGLEGVVRSLSRELASRQVTVNAIAPGVIETAMAEAAFSEQQIKQLVPMKRAGTTEEVAALVNFLVSDEAAYITGQTIAINGGMA